MIKNNHKHFNVDHEISNVTKDRHKHFDMDYDMSQVIKNNQKYFDMEYDMEVNFKAFIFWVKKQGMII